MLGDVVIEELVPLLRHEERLQTLVREDNLQIFAFELLLGEGLLQRNMHRRSTSLLEQNKKFILSLIWIFNIRQI